MSAKESEKLFVTTNLIKPDGHFQGRFIHFPGKLDAYTHIDKCGILYIKKRFPL